ncbi:PREDICTED: uncharacterized protein LOC106110278 isoform X1 [Papilio polytes]|uniref:uncharacterized protein LOC106110278 isoform X1 n=1 Tax=Papilio polytes TaxID=76194 RepID=UPI000676952C|nr:PREDICTED: uncharacterized protein LOC106110278 isoform X1 [Papilio polytes]
MDKSKHKTGKKMDKNNGKEKSPLFVSDVKNLKENLKIKEILRTVKMNSSMRLKSPQCNKTINNKDVNDNQDCFESASQELQDHTTVESNPSATNHNVITSTLNVDTGTSDNDLQKNEGIKVTIYEVPNTCTESNDSLSSNTLSENCNDLKESKNNEEITGTDNNANEVTSSSKPANHMTNLKPRDRKLSLDQTILSRRAGLSQSELDLNLIGKSPLERKSSFFRKKMDNFLKNTTEIFKRQSQSFKSQPTQRRGSKSISLQSLTDKNYPSNGYNNDGTLQIPQEMRNSATSLVRSSSMASSISPEGVEQDSPSASQPVLFTSQPLGDYSSNSVNNLNEPYVQESLLKSRAISMSSGLDAPQGRLRRKASKSNRVTWLASEGLTNYFKRVMQDEKSREVQSCHSYQDFSSIPEHASYGPTTDSKGRRLSYQRAVSGEDPVHPTRYYDTSQRRKNFIPEHQVPNTEMEAKLDEFSIYGVPQLHGFVAITIPQHAMEYLRWAEQPDEIQLYYERCNIPPTDETRQAVLRELITTEADHIRHLKSLVEVFMAAAHALQEYQFMLEVDTQQLFSNIPDLYNASLVFWNVTFYPMIVESVETGLPMKPELMYEGFHNIEEYLKSYETYLLDNTRAVEYLRSLSNHSEFMTFQSWCNKQKEMNRLQLADMLAKPMQRITKYALMMNRIFDTTEKGAVRDLVFSMETAIKNFLQHINRRIRQREEKDKLYKITNTIEPFELEFKDEEMERCFKMYSQLDLHAPMIYVARSVKRCVVYSGDLRFKDNNNKEIDVRVFLFTDMLLICKKLPKGSFYLYKMIRPKYMVDRLHFYPKYSRTTKEVVALVFVAVDDFHSAYHSFTLSEPSKEEKTQTPLKTSLLLTWDQKIKEAKISYELVIIFGQRREGMTEKELESAETSLKLMSPEEIAIEKEGREWAAVMLHGKLSRQQDYTMTNIPEDTYQITEAILVGNLEAARRWRNPVLRRYSSTTAGSSRGSRLSSLQKSTSATSRDEPQPSTSRGPYYQSDSIDAPFGKMESEDTFNDDISEDEYADSPLPSSLLTPLLSPQLSSPALQPPALHQSVIRPEVIHELALHPPMIHEAITHGPNIQEPSQAMMFEQIPSMVVQPLNQPPAIVEPVTVSIVENPPLQRAVISNPLVQFRANQVHCNPKPLSELHVAQEPKRQQSNAQLSMAVGIPIPIPIPFPLLPNLRGDIAAKSGHGEEDRGRRKKGRAIHVPRAKSVQSGRGAQIQHVQRSKSVQSAHGLQFVQQADRNQSAMSDYSVKSTQSEHVGHRKNGRGRRGKRAASASPSTLRVIPPDDLTTSMHSLPDLTVEPPSPRHPPSPQSASEQMYQSHQEQLQRNREVAQHQQYLSPDHRGTSYPPTSPSRSNLRRGFAFSTNKHPPLTKMKNVTSQANLLDIILPSSSRISRSESTSPDPEMSPERRLKGIAGSLLGSGTRQGKIEG